MAENIGGLEGYNKIKGTDSFPLYCELLTLDCEVYDIFKGQRDIDVAFVSGYFYRDSLDKSTLPVYSAGSPLHTAFYAGKDQYYIDHYIDHYAIHEGAFDVTSSEVFRTAIRRSYGRSFMDWPIYSTCSILLWNEVRPHIKSLIAAIHALPQVTPHFYALPELDHEMLREGSINLYFSWYEQNWDIGLSCQPVVEDRMVDFSVTMNEEDRRPVRPTTFLDGTFDLGDEDGSNVNLPILKEKIHTVATFFHWLSYSLEDLLENKINESYFDISF